MHILSPHRAAWAALLALTCAGPALADPPATAKYTLEDLRALAESASWGELLEHAEDLRPSERKAEWKALLEKAAVGHLDALLAQKKADEALAVSDQLRARFGTLEESKAFAEKRAAAGLAAYAPCFDNAYAAGQCVDRLNAFVESEGNPPGLSRQAGKLLVERARMRAPAAPHFARAAAADKAVCSDPSVAEAVLAAIGQPPDYDNAKAAMTLAFDTCWSVLEKPIWEAFYASGGYESRNLCTGLEKRKAKLKPFQAAYCQDQRKS